MNEQINLIQYTKKRSLCTRLLPLLLAMGLLLAGCSGGTEPSEPSSDTGSPTASAGSTPPPARSRAYTARSPSTYGSSGRDTPGTSSQDWSRPSVLLPEAKSESFRRRYTCSSSAAPRGAK